MDLLSEVKQRVVVMEGEHPESRPHDALVVAKRAGVLYRWAQNLDVYQLRWSQDHPVQHVPRAHLCNVLMKRIVEQVELNTAPSQPLEVLTSDEILEGDWPDEESINATDSALAFAEEHDIDLMGVVGSGKDGRITLGDVKKLVE